MNQVIKAIKLINKDLEKHRNDEFDTRYDEQKEQSTISLSQTIEVPSEFYKSRLVNNMKSYTTDYRFRSTRFNKIHSNISIIERMLFEENRSIKYVAKWLRIPAKTIISTLRAYFKALIRDMKKKNQKQQSKCKRRIGAKHQIDSFIKSRAGR